MMVLGSKYVGKILVFLMYKFYISELVGIIIEYFHDIKMQMLIHHKMHADDRNNPISLN